MVFNRYIGIKGDRDSYINHLKGLHKTMSMSVGYIHYNSGLIKLVDVGKIKVIKEQVVTYLDKRCEHGNNASIKQSHTLGCPYEASILEANRLKAIDDVLDLFEKHDGGNLVNFTSKIIYWLDSDYEKLNQLDHNGQGHVLYFGQIKKHELYYLILLSKLGWHVSYVNPEADVVDLLPWIDQVSILESGQSFDKLAIDFEMMTLAHQVPVEMDNQGVNKNNNVATISSDYLTRNRPRRTSKVTNANNEELSYEALALYAESVVMIKVYDKEGTIHGGGSGVVIDNEGLIVTNFHVLEGGNHFGVRFENDDKEYFVSQIIKYHVDFDLAIFRVDRRTKAIKMSYQDLRRGQKIFSIGSPMGLFNTISEGIVSGFRRFNHLDMIQITAPISPGSSGGALLDMYGNLVGITTAGITGQNLNLTVKSEYIKMIANNFL